MKAVAIHGDKSQQERMAALDAFKKNEIDILVATDVAAAASTFPTCRA
jgi:superfamily II DNA/RNA helicase